MLGSGPCYAEDMSSTVLWVSAFVVTLFATLGLFVSMLVRRLLARGAIPMNVLIDQRVPISMPQTLRVPLDAEFTVGFREVVHAEGSIPVELDLAVDTVVETSVLGLGAIKIPIKAIIPISTVLPLSSPVTVDAPKIPIRLRQDIDVRLPDFELPLKTELRVGIPVRVPGR